jgi:hypothetical protein
LNWKILESGGPLVIFAHHLSIELENLESGEPLVIFTHHLVTELENL